MLSLSILALLGLGLVFVMRHRTLTIRLMRCNARASELQRQIDKAACTWKATDV